MLGLVREVQVAESAYFDRKRPADEIGDWYVDRLLESSRLHNGKLLVATHANEVCGYASILTTVKDDEPDEIDYSYAYVQDLVVTESLRGIGIGTRLLEECEVIARACGARWLRLDVLAANHGAVRLYESRGLKPLYLSMEKPLHQGHSSRDPPS